MSAAATSLTRVEVASGLTARASVLPVHDELAGLFPWGGLRRGGTVAVHGSTALLLALLAEATAAGSWAAVVGLPDLGVLAAGEYGVALERLALVRDPGRRASAVVAALLDGVDLVAVARTDARTMSEAHARRLSARARYRGAVLLAFGSWPGADLELRCARADWTGLEAGYGYLRQREVVVTATGRGAAARPARANLLLPGPDGGIKSLGPTNRTSPAQWAKWRVPVR